MIIDKLRAFLSIKHLDYLIINTCDEFLLEYTPKELSARYYVTNFSGSTGDVLFTKDKIYLFVDSRYYEQADYETNTSLITVVKLKQGETYLSALISRIKKNKKIGVVASKTPLKFYEILKENLDIINTEIEILDKDPVFDFVSLKYTKQNDILENLPVSLCGENAKSKLLKIKQALKDKEAALITKLEDIAYYTNLRGYNIPNSSVFKAKLLICNDSTVLYTDEKIKDINNSIIVKQLKEFNKAEFGESKVYVDKSSINLKDYRKIKKPSFEINFSKEKSIKNASELKTLQEAFRLTDKVVAEINTIVNSEEIYTEYDLAQKAEELFFKYGAKALSFKTILSAGKNTSIVHYSTPSKNVKIKDGDFVLLDCGAYFEGGLATDITRTFIKGSPTKSQKKAYTTVLKAFLKGYNSKLTPKTTGFDLDKKVRNFLEENKPNGFIFGHGSGHGVGISVHEYPPSISVSNLAKFPLKPGMCFSIEPGLYKKNYGGIRLENVVHIIEKDGKLKYQSFSKVPFEEKLIDYNLLTKTEIKYLKNWQKGWLDA